MRILIFTLLLVFYFFNVKFSFLVDTYIFTALVFLLLCLYYLYLHRGLVRNSYAFATFYLLFAWCFFSFVINGFPEIHILKLMVGIYISAFVVPYVLISAFRGAKEDAIRSMAYVGVVNAIFIIVMLLSTDARMAWHSLLRSVDLVEIAGEDAYEGLLGLRLVGITGASTYGAAVMQTIFAFLYLYWIKLANLELNVVRLLTLGLIVVSAVIAGRTGFVGVFFIVLYLMRTQGLRSVKLYLFTAGTFTMFMMLAGYFMSDEVYDFFLSWVTELFTKGADTGSLQENLSMFIFDLSDFSLFGDFRWFGGADSMYYMNTDVGWYRLLFAVGVGGVDIITLFILSFLIHAFDGRSPLPWIIVFLFIVLFKGAIFFDVFQVFAVLALLSYVVKDSGVSSTRLIEVG